MAVVPLCGFYLLFHHVIVPQTYCVFLLPFLYAQTYSLEIIYLPEVGSLKWVSYWRDNYLHVNCSSLKISLRNYPLPTYSPTHWAEISLHFTGFKNRVFLLPFLICCCIGRVLSFFCRQSGLLENSGSWNISAGVVWNSACCELTYNFKRTGIPLSLCSGEENSTSSMLQAGSSVGTKGIVPFIWMELS